MQLVEQNVTNCVCTTFFLVVLHSNVSFMASQCRDCHAHMFN